MVDPYFTKKEVQKRIISMFQPKPPLSLGDRLRESIQKRKAQMKPKLPRI